MIVSLSLLAMPCLVSNIIMLIECPLTRPSRFKIERQKSEKKKIRKQNISLAHSVHWFCVCQFRSCSRYQYTNNIYFLESFHELQNYNGLHSFIYHYYVGISWTFEHLNIRMCTSTARFNFENSHLIYYLHTVYEYVNKSKRWKLLRYEWMTKPPSSIHYHRYTASSASTTSTTSCPHGRWIRYGFFCSLL